MNALALSAPVQHASPLAVRGLSPTALGIVLGLHGLALLALMSHQVLTSPPEEAPVIMVSLQREVQPPQPVAQPQPQPESKIRPTPRQSEPTPARKPAPVPLLAAQPTPVPTAEPPRTVEAAPPPKAQAEPVVQPQTRPVEAAVPALAKAAPAPLAVVAPRFDADYLDNPSPTYPPLSRREGEEGTVMLSVYVDASGQAGKVELARSSGFERLDRAALAAVKRWRFVPARRGSEAVADWVRVPIVFSLKE